MHRMNADVFATRSAKLPRLAWRKAIAEDSLGVKCPCGYVFSQAMTKHFSVRERCPTALAVDGFDHGGNSLPIRPQPARRRDPAHGDPLNISAVARLPMNLRQLRSGGKRNFKRRLSVQRSAALLGFAFNCCRSCLFSSRRRCNSSCTRRCATSRRCGVFDVSATRSCVK